MNTNSFEIDATLFLSSPTVKIFYKKKASTLQQPYHDT